MLQKERHPNLDFFIADFSTWSLKDAQHSMEHPFFSLSKRPDCDIRRYEHNGSTITITPSILGIPTIWDKDVLIYCCSQLIEGMRQGREPAQVIRLTVYDLLVSTNRSIGIRGYELLKRAFERLRGVSIVTNIKTGGVEIEHGFGLIEWWKIIRRSKTDSRMVGVEVKLSDWLYNAVTNFEVLTLDREYFRLDGGVERRLYELARKHCGNQASWSIALALLHKKSGSRAPLRNFRIAVQKLTKANYLPGYRLRFDQKNDQLTVYTTGSKGALREIRDVLGSVP